MGIQKQKVNNLSRLSIEVNPQLHRQIKMYSALHQQTIRDYVLSSVLEKIQSETYQIPTDLTEQILKATDENKDLKQFNSADDLFKDLGI